MTSVLILNRKFQPINVTNVYRGLTMLYLGVARAVDEQYRVYDFQSWSDVGVTNEEESIGLVSRRIRIPWVLALSAYEKLPRLRVRFSRLNIYARDENTCQYCGKHFPRVDLNLDHVLPRSQGGKTCWENVVCSCIECNLRKGGRTPVQANMRLLREPLRPRWTPFIRGGYKEPLRKAWLPFMSLVEASYWNVELLEE